MMPPRVLASGPLGQNPAGANILFPGLLNHVLFTSLRVRAVELVILVKPIGIFTHVLMNIFFGTKIHMFLSILIVLGIVETVVMPPVLKLLILLRLSHNLKSRRVSY